MKLALLVLLSALLPLSQASRAFDLVCAGERSVSGASPQPFTTRIRVDPQSEQFCFDPCRYRYHLTRIAPGRIEYDYDVRLADRDHPAGLVREGDWTTAGPWDFQDSFRVDLQTGEYERTYVYEFGDIVARTRNERHRGRCEIAPFTPFPAGSRVTDKAGSSPTPVRP